MGIDTEKVYSFTFSLNAAICGARRRIDLDDLGISTVHWIDLLHSRFRHCHRCGPWQSCRRNRCRSWHGCCGAKTGAFALGTEFQQAIVVGLLIVVLNDQIGYFFKTQGGGRIMNSPFAKFCIVCLNISVGHFAANLFPPTMFGQMTVMWMMVIFALTWDVLGGQMGYNSLGNIFFFGVGMYASAMVQVGMFYDLAKYTDAAGGGIYTFSFSQYFTGISVWFRCRRYCLCTLRNCPRAFGIWTSRSILRHWYTGYSHCRWRTR